MMTAHIPLNGEALMSPRMNKLTKRDNLNRSTGSQRSSST